MQSVQIDFGLIFWQKISGFETHDFYEIPQCICNFLILGEPQNVGFLIISKDQHYLLEATLFS